MIMILLLSIFIIITIKMSSLIITIVVIINFYFSVDFGTQFVDINHQLYNLQVTSARTILLNRAKFIEKMNIPKSAHLYIICHSLSKVQ